MSRIGSFIECDEQTRDILWEALYAAAGAMLNNSKKDLKMFRMVKEHPEWEKQKDNLAFWRECLAKDMAKYREIVRCREEWWSRMSILRLPVDSDGQPKVKQ